MDAPSDQSTPTGAASAHLTPQKVVRSRRRRPTGAPPPLPHHLRTSGVGWLCATVRVAVLYRLVPGGRWRNTGKWAAAGLVVLVGVARIALGVDAPTDVLVAVGIGVAIPLLAFRWFAPDEVFPVVYRRGRSAHLDGGGARGGGIRRAVEEQLGLAAGEIEPFGLARSAGAPPLRITGT